MTNFVIVTMLNEDEQLIKDLIPVFGKCSKKRFPGQPKNMPSAMYKLSYSVDGEYTNEQLLDIIPESIRDKYGLNSFNVVLEEVKGSVSTNKSSALNSLLNATDNMSK